MSLTKTWAPLFRSSVRMAGRAYQTEGKVRQLPPAAGELVRAQVQGSREYLVSVRGDGSTAAVSCTCPYFAGGQYCKHIWATLLDVQINGLLTDTQVAGTLPEAADLEQNIPQPPKARKRDPGRRGTTDGEPEWVGKLTLLRPSPALLTPTPPLIQGLRQVCYVVNVEQSIRTNGLVIDLHQRQPTRAGWSGFKRLPISQNMIAGLTDPLDRELCALILGGTAAARTADWEYSDALLASQDSFRLACGAGRTLLQRLIASGRCFVEAAAEEEFSTDAAAAPLRWDGAEPWTLWLVGTDTGDGLALTVELRRGEARLPITAPSLILGGIDGLVFYDSKAAPFDDRDAFRWVVQFRDDMRAHGRSGPIRVPAADIPRFLQHLYSLPQLPEIDLPEGVGRSETHVEPVPHLELFSPGAVTTIGGQGPRNLLTGRLWYAYGAFHVKPGQPGRFVPTHPEAAAESGAGDDVDAQGPQLIRRDLRQEEDALTQLIALGFRPDTPNGGRDLTGVLPVKRLAPVANELLRRGWVVLADRKAMHYAGTPSFSVTSGIDWFELRGGVRFQTAQGEQVVSLPEILAAAHAGRALITLGDGSQGLLPEEWLQQHGLLTTVGKVEGDHFKFKRSQIALLDALVRQQDVVDVDERFAAARQRLHGFNGIQEVAPAPTFSGSLRPYQREGLGWLEFLRWFGMAGILADDMGLGKTVQILAMLDALKDGEGEPAGVAEASAGTGPTSAGTAPAPPPLRRQQQRVLPLTPKLPSLIVVPRSVVFNWLDEATRFTPALRVQAYTGGERHMLRPDFADYDVIVTTYGLIRRDIEELRQLKFNYVVLDEAQTIKNPSSQVAKAVRLLQPEHRLALTGTPIENHLGDLWSIFEFLNPGMLGNATAFGRMLRNAAANGKNGAEPAAEPGTDTAGDDEVQALNLLQKKNLQNVAVAGQLAAALKPFILRRTKKQVLRDLPEKTEQTILCQLEPPQRAVYDQLLKHYRGTLLQQVGAGGVARSAVQVLEALLRLRQAACHPGLIDANHQNHPSAKLDTILERLTDLIEEGHKALVFSQFTSFLAILRQRLDERGIAYEYLDGQTRHRKKHVERFQTDPTCPIFLISLKAGGLGLNLTAAEYVFILDPWWNPAVESQAIDRAHRIGQTRHVFAYRLICADTVEQRIAQLQQKKRQLADALIGEQESLLKALTREDLELLLS